MKTLITLLFSLLILSSGAFAQNFNQNGYGVNQDLGRNSSPSKPSQQDIDENNYIKRTSIKKPFTDCENKEKCSFFVKK